MKHALLFFALLLSVGAWALPVKKATFNFSRPQSLTPSYTESAFNTDAGASIKVSDVKFTSGDITLSFNDEQNATGDWLAKHTSSDQSIYYTLDMSDNSRMVVSGADVKILSVTVGKGSTQGGFGLEKGQGGTFNTASSNFCCQWKADGSTYHSVSFFVSGSGTGAHFNTVTVEYSPKADVLTPSSTTLADGATVGSFSSFGLDFGKSISLLDGTATLTTPDGKTQSLNASASGSTLTLGVSNALTDEGSYTISVPNNMIEDAEGYTNTSLSYTFTVKKDRAIFNPVTVDPAEGYVGKSLKSTITITFPDAVGTVNTEGQALMLNGRAKIGITFKKSDTDSKSIVGTINGGKDVTDEGTWTLTLPEGFVHNELYNVPEYDNWNKETTFTWSVTSKAPDTETMKDAKALLAITGVGYPATDSEARKALANLVNAETTPSDDDLKVAMANFYKETNVTLPEDGKYYKIYGVNSEGKKLYLAYDGSSVKLSTSANDAYAFKAEAKGGSKEAFSTLDGKYLHVLMNSKGYDLTSSNNITDSYLASVNDLTLTRLASDAIDSKLTFGKFFVNGYLGKKKHGTDTYVNALIDFSKNVEQPVSGPDYPDIFFQKDFSNAFVFEESTKPAEESVDVDVTFTPNTIKSLSDEMTLSFTHNSGVTLKDGTVLIVTDENGNAVSGASATITPLENSDMDFVIKISGITKDGTYNLVFPKGTFSFVDNNKQVISNELTETFTLSTSSTPDPTPDPTPSDFKHYQQWEKLPKEGGSQAEYPKDYITQYIVLIDRAQTNGLVGNPKARVELVEFSNNKLMGYGHFEADPEHTDKINYALKLVWDQPIDMVHVRTTDYAFKIPEGAFGDSNYGKYLKDPSSVKSSDCTVNNSFMRTYSINTTLTGIRDINAEGNAPKVIYDLQGRRVERVTKTGIYIVNGKKMVIRK